ncbi:MAG: glycosyltransferase, partial [Bacteroidota bacterium]|nr:glycosyltransferase [Bacteroidota bacterium]
MHILVIPSEQFIPPQNKLDGIFQYHQATILRDAGHQIGVLSIKLSFSVPMIVKGIFFKIIGKKAGNETDEFRLPALLKLGIKKIFRKQSFVSREVIDGLTIYRVDGLYLRPPVQHQNHISWIKAGIICFRQYLQQEGRPDIIHAHNAVYAGMLAERLHQEFGIRYIITEHSSIYALNE